MNKCERDLTFKDLQATNDLKPESLQRKYVVIHDMKKSSYHVNQDCIFLCHCIIR